MYYSFHVCTAHTHSRARENGVFFMSVCGCAFVTTCLLLQSMCVCVTMTAEFLKCRSLRYNTCHCLGVFVSFCISLCVRMRRMRANEHTVNMCACGNNCATACVYVENGHRIAMYMCVYTLGKCDVDRQKRKKESSTLVAVRCFVFSFAVWWKASSDVAT